MKVEEVKTNVYLELDCLYDVRRVILESFLKEGVTFEESLEEAYRARRRDVFNFPEFGITNEEYHRRYASRGNSELVKAKPTALIALIGQIVHRTIQNKYKNDLTVPKFKITINLFPYQIDAELADVLTDSIASHLGVYEVEFILTNKPFNTLTPEYLKKFNFLFKYGFFIEKDSEKIITGLNNCHMPDTIIIVPELLLKEIKGADINIGDSLLWLSNILGTSIDGIYPLPTKTFDYFTKSS